MRVTTRAGTAPTALSVKVVLPNRILEKTIDVLREYGRKMLECHALWVGGASQDAFEVSDVWVPDQHCTAITYEVDELEVFRINKALHDAGLICMCQVHTHPGTAFHSSVDDAGSELALPGSLSVVVPYYGQVERSTTASWRAYVYDGRRWAGMTRAEIREVFVLK